MRSISKTTTGRQSNPFNFLSTAYPRSIYKKVEGYRGNRLINPDKWFHWRLLGEDIKTIFIDRPLFAYRWHSSNQTAIQNSSSTLKYLVDEYCTTLELDAKLLERIGFSRDVVEKAFIEYDIARHGLATLAKGDRPKAQRILDFGNAVYPVHLRRNWHAKTLQAFLLLGSIGQSIAWAAYEVYQRKRDQG